MCLKLERSTGGFARRHLHGTRRGGGPVGCETLGSEGGRRAGRGAVDQRPLRDVVPARVMGEGNATQSEVEEAQVKSEN